MGERGGFNKGGDGITRGGTKVREELEVVLGEEELAEELRDCRGEELRLEGREVEE